MITRAFRGDATRMKIHKAHSHKKASSSRLDAVMLERELYFSHPSTASLLRIFRRTPAARASSQPRTTPIHYKRAAMDVVA